MTTTLDDDSTTDSTTCGSTPDSTSELDPMEDPPRPNEEASEEPATNSTPESTQQPATSSSDEPRRLNSTTDEPRRLPLPVSFKELEMLTKACLAADVTPRSIKRLVNVFKVMRNIWYHQKEVLCDLLKEACMLLLAMCASESNTRRHWVGGIFERMKMSVNRPTEVNLKAFTTTSKDGQCSGIKVVDDAFEKVEWSDDTTWKVVKAHLQLVRSFSFVETYSAQDDRGEEDKTTLQKLTDALVASQRELSTDSNMTSTRTRTSHSRSRSPR
jgi:hypothetical protein